MGLFSSIGKLFGGGSKKSTQESIYAKPVFDALSPMMNYGGQGMGMAANILGLGGSEAGDQALGDWWGSSGGNFLLGQGLDQVDAMYRSRGLGQSGAAMKAMEDYRSGLASTKLNEYLGNLFNMNQQALGAGALVSGAGQYSKGTGSGGGGGGLGQAIGTALAIFSDRRLKRDIERIGSEPDGLGIYRHRYHGDNTQRVGVMADEVAALRPWALGPEIGGFKTVRYDLLEAT